MSIKVTYMNCNQFYSCHVTYIFIDGVSYYLFICSVLLILLLREIYSCVSRSEWLFRMTVIHPFIADCAKRALIHIRYLYWIRECFLYVFDFYHVLFRCLDFLFFFGSSISTWKTSTGVCLFSLYCRYGRQFFTFLLVILVVLRCTFVMYSIRYRSFRNLMYIFLLVMHTCQLLPLLGVYL